jgi:hypothetical protein
MWSVAVLGSEARQQTLGKFSQAAQLHPQLTANSDWVLYLLGGKWVRQSRLVSRLYRCRGHRTDTEHDGVANINVAKVVGRFIVHELKLDACSPRLHSHHWITPERVHRNMCQVLVPVEYHKRSLEKRDVSDSFFVIT